MEIFFILAVIVLVKLIILYGLCVIGYHLLVYIVRKFLKDIRSNG